jgi:broad specificity phosphatase PhoE
MMTIRKIIFVRHGETDWNTTGRLNSFTDLDITTRGEKKLQHTKHIVSQIPVQTIFSSPLRRAIQTTKILFPNRDYHRDARLVELNFGLFEGKTRDELLTGELAETYQNWAGSQNIHESVLGTESYQSVIDRAQSFLEDILKLDGNSVIVSHGVFIRIFLCHCVLGLKAFQFRTLQIDNGGLAIINLEQHMMRLAGLNV